MKRILLFCLLASMASVHAQAQLSLPALNDAITIRKYIVQKNGHYQFKLELDTKFLNTLAKYNPGSRADSSISLEGLKKTFINNKNPFIGKLIPFPTSGVLSELSTSTGPAMMGSSLGAGGLSVANLADGLAKFLVKRTKQELSIAFFRKFKDVLLKDPRMNTLFPRTAVQLASIDTHIYQFSAYLETMRGAFVRDLKALPEHTADLLKGDALKELSSSQRQVAVTALTIGQQLVDGSSFNQISQSLSRVKLDSVKSLEGTLRTIGMLSSSLRKENDWISVNDLEQAISDPPTLAIYLGLVWQESDGIVYSTHTNCTFRDMLSKSVESVPLENLVNNPRVQSFMDFLRTSLNWGTQTKAVSEKMNRSVAPDYEDYSPVVSSFTNMFKAGVQFRDASLSLNRVKAPAFDELATLSDIINEAFLVYLDARQKHYADAIVDVMTILRLTYGNHQPEWVQQILKYGTFMATVAEAQSSDQVEAAIESFALPPGSSTTKKYAAFNLSVTAYTGPSFGWEKLMNVPDSINTGNKGINYFSLWAPVGFAVTPFGFGRAGSLSFFFPVIDVGAITAYRFDSKNVGELPQLSFSNIIAPGAFISYGFPFDLPLALSVGCQLGPNLRSVKAGNYQIDDARAWRIGVGLTVDIPMLQLANTPKK